MKEPYRYKVRISTIQHDISDEMVVEEAEAAYDHLGGTHHICYYSKPDSDASVKNSSPEEAYMIRNIISFNGDVLKISRSGAANGHILYKTGKKTKTILDLGFSEICIENDTKMLDGRFKESSETFDISVGYDLYLNGSFVSCCSTRIELLTI